MVNRPSLKYPNQAKFSTCSHSIEGYFKTLIGPLTQSKLKWNQDCIICDKKNVSLNAYINDSLLEVLLDLSCTQAKELFKMSKRSNKQYNEDEHFLLFERKRKECELKLEKMNCLYSLKFDLDRNKFCINKIVIIDLNR